MNCIASNVEEHKKTTKRAMDAGFIPLSSSEIVEVNTSRKTNTTFLGLVLLTQVNNKRHKKRRAVTQCSVEGKRKVGLMFMQL